MTHFILSLYHIICITQLIITLVNGETSPDKCISYGPPDFIPSGFHGIFFPTEFGIDPATLYYRMNALQNAITEDVLRDTFSASEVSFNVPATNSDTPQTGLIWGVETTTTNFTLLGYNLFKPNVTGTYTFSVDKVNKDGGGALYIVESAHILCCDTTSMGSLATDKTAYNIPADISHSNLNVTLELDSSRYYVVFIIYANTKGSAQFEMSVTIPDGAKIPDGTGFFGALSDATCNAIRPLKTITSIGDVLSPTTYATSFSSTITVVSGTTLDEYDTIYYVTVPSSTKTASITSTETEPMLLPTDYQGFPIVDGDLYHGGTGFVARLARPDDEMYPHNPQIINPDNLLDVYAGLGGDYPLNTTTPAFDIPLQGTLTPQNATLYDTTIDISNTIILYKGIFKAPASGNYKLSIDYNGVGATAALFPLSLMCGYEYDEAPAGYPHILNVASMASGPDFSGSASNETYLTAGQSYVFTMAYENISLFPGYNRTTTASFHPSLTFPNGVVVTDFSNLVHKYSHMEISDCFLHKTKTVEYPWTGTYSTTYATFTNSLPTEVVVHSRSGTLFRVDVTVYALSPTSSSTISSTLISSSSSIPLVKSSSTVTIPSSTSSLPSSIPSSLKSINSSVTILSYPTNSSQLQAFSSTPLNPVHSSNITSSVDVIPTDKNSTIRVSQSSATVFQSSAIVSNSSSYASIVRSISNSQVVQISSTPNREIISSNNSMSSTQLNTPPSIASTRKTSLFASTAVYSESARFGNTTNQELSTTSIHFSDTTSITPSRSMTHDGASKVTSITYGEEISRLSELSNDIFTTSTYVDSHGFTITTIINCSNNIDNSNSAVKSESLYLNTMQTTTAVTTAVLQDTVVTDTTKQNVPTTTKTSSVVQYGPLSNSISIRSSSLPTAALFSPENENNAIKNSSQMMILLLALLHVLTFI